MLTRSVRRLIPAAASIGLTAACGDGEIAGGDQGLLPEPPPGDSSGFAAELEAFFTTLCQRAVSCYSADYSDDPLTVDECVQEFADDIEITAEPPGECVSAFAAYADCYAANLRCIAVDGEPELSAGNACDAQYGDMMAQCEAYVYYD